MKYSENQERVILHLINKEVPTVTDEVIKNVIVSFGDVNIVLSEEEFRGIMDDVATIQQYYSYEEEYNKVVNQIRKVKLEKIIGKI